MQAIRKLVGVADAIAVSERGRGAVRNLSFSLAVIFQVTAVSSSAPLFFLT